MSLKIVNRQYFQAGHPADPTTFLLQNSGKKIKEVITIEFDFDFTSSSNEALLVNDVFSFKINGSWDGKGFVVGDSVNLTGTLVDSNGGTSDLSASNPFTIQEIDGDIIRFTSGFTAPSFVGVLSPQQNGSTTVTISNNSRSAPEDLVCFHSLVENSDPQNNNSIIDGEVNKFVYEGLDALAVNDTVNLIQEGDKSGGTYTGTHTVKRIADVGGKQRYNITLFYFLPDIEDANFDTPAWFEAENCLKATYNIIGYPQSNNPNSVISTKYAQTLGNNGWYGEEHNQGLNDFIIDSVSITSVASGAILNRLDPNQACRIVAIITSDSDFADFYEAKFSIIPPTADYKNNEFSHLENTFFSYIFNDNGTISDREEFGKNSGLVEFENEAIANSTNQITVTFDFVPNAAFTNYINSLFESEQLYRLSVSVESVGGTGNENNNVSLILSEGQFEKEPLPDEPFDGVKSQGFINHWGDVDTDTPTSTYEGCTEDDFVHKSVITLEKSVSYLRLSGSIEVVRTSDGQDFDLLSKTIPLNNYLVSPDGTQNINYSEPIQQFLDAPKRNFLTVKNTGTSTATDYDVEIVWSLMANWRYWLENSNAFNDFIDTSLPNDGLNAEWMRYLRENGYQIRLRMRLELEEQALYWGGLIRLQDYEDNLADPDIETTISLFDENGDLAPEPISGQIMTLRADHLNTINDWNQSDVSGWMTVRQFENDPSKRLSTFWDWSSQDNPFKPKQGQTTAELTFPALNIARVECLVDASQLISLNKDFDVSFVARIETPIQTECIHPIDYIFDYIEFYTQGNDELDLYNQALNQVVVTETNVCCPTCTLEYTSVFGDVTTFAFGNQTDLDIIIGNAINEEQLCCYNVYQATTPYAACSDSFNVDIDTLGFGDNPALKEIIEAHTPAILNSYSGVNEVLKLRDRLEQLTNDLSIRLLIVEEVFSRGILMRCDANGNKYLTRY